MDQSIRVDEDVFKALQSMAQAFVDTPNSVLRRLLRLDGDDEPSASPATKPGGPSTSSPRKALAQPAYEVPLLKAISDLGGHGTRAKVLEMLERQMGDKFGAMDLAPIRSGAIRWTKTASWAIKSMKFRGLIDPDSPHGIWTITPKGREYLTAEQERSAH